MTDIYAPSFVKGVFDRCSDKYIWFSYLCSFGFTERWRRQCVALLDMNVSKPVIGYDLMAGTGEAWPHLLKRYPNISEITAVDISSGMHERALKQLHQSRENKISFIEDDVFNSEFPTERADFVVSTFGLKTFNVEQHKKTCSISFKHFETRRRLLTHRSFRSKKLVVEALIQFLSKTSTSAGRATVYKGRSRFLDDQPIHRELW